MICWENNWSPRHWEITILCLTVRIQEPGRLLWEFCFNSNSKLRSESLQWSVISGFNDFNDHLLCFFSTFCVSSFVSVSRQPCFVWISFPFVVTQSFSFFSGLHRLYPWNKTRKKKSTGCVPVYSKMRHAVFKSSRLINLIQCFILKPIFLIKWHQGGSFKAPAFLVSCCQELWRLA